jgi:hypothetical protein
MGQPLPSLRFLLDSPQHQIRSPPLPRRPQHHARCSRSARGRWHEIGACEELAAAQGHLPWCTARRARSGLGRPGQAREKERRPVWTDARLREKSRAWRVRPGRPGPPGPARFAQPHPGVWPRGEEGGGFDLGGSGGPSPRRRGCWACTPRDWLCRGRPGPYGDSSRWARNLLTRTAGPTVAPTETAPARGDAPAPPAPSHSEFLGPECRLDRPARPGSRRAGAAGRRGPVRTGPRVCRRAATDGGAVAGRPTPIGGNPTFGPRTGPRRTRGAPNQAASRRNRRSGAAALSFLTTFVLCGMSRAGQPRFPATGLDDTPRRGGGATISAEQCPSPGSRQEWPRLAMRCDTGQP